MGPTQGGGKSKEWWRRRRKHTDGSRGWNGMEGVPTIDDVEASGLCSPRVARRVGPRRDALDGGGREGHP